MTFETLDRSASILVYASWSAIACIFALFLPSHTSKVDRRCSRGILREFKLHKVPNCVCFTKRLRGRSCLYEARPRLLNINCRHSFQSCATASIPWFSVAMIMNVLAGWFFPSDYFLKWRYFCSHLVPIFSHNAVKYFFLVTEHFQASWLSFFRVG